MSDWKDKLKRIQSNFKPMMALADGYSWNPLLNFPRNSPCPCDSKKKFKNCHQSKLPKAIPTAMADEYKLIMKQSTFEAIKFEGSLDMPAEETALEADPQPNL